MSALDVSNDRFLGVDTVKSLISVTASCLIRGKQVAVPGRRAKYLVSLRLQSCSSERSVMYRCYKCRNC